MEVHPRELIPLDLVHTDGRFGTCSCCCAYILAPCAAAHKHAAAYSQVVAFIKGTRTQPQCGFSYKVLSILNDIRIPYEVVKPGLCLDFVRFCKVVIEDCGLTLIIGSTAQLCERACNNSQSLPAGECARRAIQPWTARSDQEIQRVAHHPTGGQTNDLTRCCCRDYWLVAQLHLSSTGLPLSLHPQLLLC